MLKGFKEFILRGNVIDLAVGVVIGAAFGAVVEALVKDILTPLIGAIARVPNFSGLAFRINGSAFMYGAFINALISFLLVSASIYFFVVVPVSKLVPKKVTAKDCIECCSTIPLEAKRCKHCGQAV